MERIKSDRPVYTLCSYLLLWIGCMATLAGCIKESIIDSPKEDSTVSFTFAVPGMVPSRAVTDTHECMVDNVWILLFDDSWEYVGKYKGTTPQDDGVNIARKTFQVKLPVGSYHLFAVINSETQLNALTLTEGMTRADIEKALLFRMEQAWGYTPGTFTSFPMWGMLENVQVAAATPVREIPVIRTTVRIDIKLGSNVVSATQKITSVYLYNRYTAGQIIPNQQNVNINESSLSVGAPSLPQNESKTQLPLLYTFDPATDEVTYTVYTFEAPAGSASDLLNNTCLVIGIGNKDDGGGGATRAEIPYPNLPVFFYRVDFINEEGTYLPLLRNHQYVVTVDQIINQGFPEPGQAFRSQPYGMQYMVVPWEVDDDNNVDVIGDIYRLDISETFLEFGPSGYEATIQVSTTHPDGWSAYFSAYPDRIDPGPVGWMNSLLAYDGLSPEPYQSVINLPAEKTVYLMIQLWNPGLGTYTGYIHIVSGNLTNVITIKKTGMDVS